MSLDTYNLYNSNYNMGNEQRPESGNEVYLTQIQNRSIQELMYQSKLSCTKFDTKLAKKIYTFGSGSDYVASYIQKLKFFGQYIECDNLMLPVYCYIREQKNICSDEKELQIYHQIYSINIKDEIVARKRQFQKFSQTQVWYLLFALVNACRKFEPYKMKSGNLKTIHIHLNNNGHVKVRNQLTEPNQAKSQPPNFYSPQEMANLRDNNSKVHPNICQTFSIAIILIQICTFIEGDSFYDLYRMKINEVNLGRALEMIEKLKYSKLLVNLLKIMLSGQNDRPLPSQIYQTFKPYQQQINSLQPFKFDTNRIYQSLHNSKASYY